MRPAIFTHCCDFYGGESMNSPHTPGTASPFVLRFFAALCVPLACWQIWIFPMLPNYYAQHIFIYPTLIFLVWAWRHGLWTLHEAWQTARPWLPWIVVLCCMQALAGWHSAQQYAQGGRSIPLSVLIELGKLLIQLPFLLIFTLLCRVVLRDAAARHTLLWGALTAFAALALLCMVQAVWVYSASWPWLAQTGLPERCRDILLALSPYLEARWHDGIYDFYSQGAYALTLLRINGLFEEASALSALLAVFFTPLAFGLMRMGRRDAVIAGALIFAVCCFLCVICQSTTGQVLALIMLGMLGMLILTAFKGRYRVWGTLCVLAFAAVCVYVALTLPNVSTYFKDRIKNHTVSTMPRTVITLDTFDIIAGHPLLGVGRGWYFAHLHEGQRFMRNLHNLELRTWKERGMGAELAALPALAAQYGLPVILAALFVVWRVWRRLHCMRRDNPHTINNFMASACTAWIVLAFVTTLASIDIRNPLFCLPFFFFCATARAEHTS